MITKLNSCSYISQFKLYENVQFICTIGQCIFIVLIDFFDPLIECVRPKSSLYEPHKYWNFDIQLAVILKMIGVRGLK